MQRAKGGDPCLLFCTSGMADNAHRSIRRTVFENQFRCPCQIIRSGFGAGVIHTFSGTIAIAIFTFGIVAKMLFESIETIDMGPFEAMEALGANKFQAFWSACVPQILPVYLSHSLYCFEMNVRASAILGYVGAGGLGITINERIGWRDYNSLGTVLLSLFVVVVIIDFFSEYLRKKLS